MTQETHTYEYQNGNILFDHVYNYTEGELPANPKRSEQYFYENPVWGDMLTGTATVYYNDTSRASAQSADTVGRELAPAADATNADYVLAKRLLGEHCVAKEMPESLLTRKSANQMSAYSADTTVVRDRMYIESDEIGNPVNIGGTLLEWNGRQLQSMDNGDFSVSYSYNTDGQRVKKIASASDGSLTYTYEYFYNGEIFAGQRLTKIEDGVEKNYTVALMYDNNGEAFGFICNGEPYYYVKNAQNDVILIMNADGVAVVLYQYDAWGKITQYFDGTEEEIGLINPLFYRSYYLDLEAEMYYLNSRYYVPGLCRFLNADAVVAGTGESVQGYNMFAYCFNNPVSLSDQDGKWPVLAIIAVVTAAIVAVTTVANHIINAVNSNKIDKEINNRYTQEEATAEINKILNQNNSSSSVQFNADGVKIQNSYKIKRRDRQKICKIIIRTEGIDASRTFGNMSSEWLLHNIFYNLHIKRAQAQDADLEYAQDSRWYIRGVTLILEFFGWE